MARKGEKCYYENWNKHIAGPELPDDAKHSAATFDGKETRILRWTNVGRMWEKDNRHTYQQADEFLGLQGMPTNNFFVALKHHPKRMGCDVVKLLQGETYKVSQEATGTSGGVVVVSADDDRIFFDPARNYAITGREIIDPETKELLQRFTYEDFFELAPGVTLAKTIVCEMYHASELESRWRLQVLDVNTAEVPDKLFTYQFAPTTLILDYRGEFASNPIAYRAPAKPENLDKVIAEAKARRERYELNAKHGYRARFAILLVNLGLVAALVVIILARRAKGIAV
jgi:hypothetical protein